MECRRVFALLEIVDSLILNLSIVFEQCQKYTRSFENDTLFDVLLNCVLRIKKHCFGKSL